MPMSTKKITIHKLIRQILRASAFTEVTVSFAMNIAKPWKTRIILMSFIDTDISDNLFWTMGNNKKSYIPFYTKTFHSKKAEKSSPKLFLKLWHLSDFLCQELGWFMTELNGDIMWKIYGGCKKIVSTPTMNGVHFHTHPNYGYLSACPSVTDYKTTFNKPNQFVLTYMGWVEYGTSDDETLDCYARTISRGERGVLIVLSNSLNRLTCKLTEWDELFLL